MINNWKHDKIKVQQYENNDKNLNTLYSIYVIFIHFELDEI